MMKARIVAFLLVGIALFLAYARPVGSRGGIVVGGADEIWESPTTFSPELATYTDGIGPRVVTQFANAIGNFAVSELPGPLTTLLGQVTDTITIGFANANGIYDLVYPFDLIGDETPPVATSISAETVGEDSIIVSWTTNEFTSSRVSYGTQPGTYTQTISDPFYVKEHEVTLGNLVSGTSYYYVVGGTDISGNTYQSPEQSVVHSPVRFLFLPRVTR